MQSHPQLAVWQRIHAAIEARIATAHADARYIEGQSYAVAYAKGQRPQSATRNSQLATRNSPQKK